MVGTCRKCGIKGELHTTNTNMCASVDYPDGWRICCNCYCSTYNPFYAEGMHPAANANAQVDAPRITAAARAEAQQEAAERRKPLVTERRKKEAKGEKNRRKATLREQAQEAEMKCHAWEHFNQAACQQCKERRRSWQGQDQDGVRTEPQGTAAAAAAETSAPGAGAV